MELSQNELRIMMIMMMMMRSLSVIGEILQKIKIVGTNLKPMLSISHTKKNILLKSTLMLLLISSKCPLSERVKISYI